MAGRRTLKTLRFRNKRHRPSRLRAGVRRGHQRQDQRHQGGLHAPIQARHGGGRGPGAWVVQLTHQGVYFVTRLKDNASFEIVENRPVPTGTKFLNFGASRVLDSGDWRVVFGRGRLHS
jgi:hypothetical protein